MLSHYPPSLLPTYSSHPTPLYDLVYVTLVLEGDQRWEQIPTKREMVAERIQGIEVNDQGQKGYKGRILLSW